MQRTLTKGTTLLELVIATSIISICFLSIVGIFGGVSSAVHAAKGRTLGTNLAQEKVEVLKQKSYYRVYVTTDSVTHPVFGFEYDNGYYPPEELTVGGVEFQRYTLVRGVQETSTGDMEMLPFTNPDTGMKMVTQTVVWAQGSSFRKVQINNILHNPDIQMSNAIFSGLVKVQGSGAPLFDARVNAAENMGWQDVTNSAGYYTFGVRPGSYNLVVQAQGYFTASVPGTVGANQSKVMDDIYLTRMSTGIVRGAVWMNEHLVISQVVVSSGNMAGLDQEYIELFNPSTSTVIMYDFPNPNYRVFFKDNEPTTNAPAEIPLTYVSTFVPPGAYFLIANTQTVTAGNVTRTADAYYTAVGADVMPVEQAAGVGLIDANTNLTVDALAWARSNGTIPAPAIYTEQLPVVENIGLQNNEAYVRKSSTSGYEVGVGRAYDSGTNLYDFQVFAPVIPVRNSSDVELIVAGTPVPSANVTCDDGLSAGTRSALTGGTTPYAEFWINNVATGPWTVVISSSYYYTVISSVVLTANATTFLTNNVTSPPWPKLGTKGFNTTILSSSTVLGFVAGRIRDALNAAITPNPRVTADGVTLLSTNNQGDYLIQTETGTFTVIANPANINPQYVSASSQVTVTMGQVVNNVDFFLSKGGKINGRITRDGTNPIPGVGVVALDANGVAGGQEVSGADGNFVMANLATGTYTVEPVLDSGEQTNPPYTTVNVTAGATVSAGTFTVTGSFGTLAGSLSASGRSIGSGVLVIVTTAVLSGYPPVLSQATLVSAPYYAAASMEDGSYSVDVRASTATTYRAYAYYPKFNGTTSTTTVQSASSITIKAGETTTVNFSW